MPINYIHDDTNNTSPNTYLITTRIGISSHRMQQLPSDFVPGEYDVICARGKKSIHHPGNKRFREMIKKYLKSYSDASSKLEKSLLVSSIIDSVRQASPMGGFVKEENGVWYEVGDNVAREKCGQSFRDLLHTKYRSSTKAKLNKRQNLQDELDCQVQELFNSNETVALKMEQLKHNPSISEEQILALFNETNAMLLGEIKRQVSEESVNSTLETKEDDASETPTERSNCTAWNPSYGKAAKGDLLE